MKKLFYFLFIMIFSFSFYSCASKPAEKNDIDSATQIENLSDVIENEKPAEETQESDEIQEEVIEDTEEPEEEIDIQNKREIPEDLVEPEVTDIIEIEEEPVVTITEEDVSEPVTPDVLDDISEPEIIVEEISNEDFIEVEVTEISEEELPEEKIEIIEEKEDINLPKQDVFTEDAAPVETVETVPPIVETTVNETSSVEVVVEPASENATTSDEITDIIEDTVEENNNVIVEIIPSRSVQLKKGEYLDVIYPGSGWVYAGVTDGSKDVVYNGRKLGTANTTFTLIAKKDGTKIVHFYKTDTITNDYIDDYLEVIISSEKTNSKTHKTAPDYASLVPEKTTDAKTTEKSKKSEKEIKNENIHSTSERINELKQSVQEKEIEQTSVTGSEIEKQNILPQVKTQNSNMDDDIEVLDVSEIDEVESIVPEIDPVTLLQTAYSYFNEKDFDNALTTISEYINITDKKKDEGLYLKGQILEAQSGIQNINKAVKEYEKILNDYPSSKYWDKANKRIIYLKRFYLEVR